MALTLRDLKTRIGIYTGGRLNAGEAELLVQDRYQQLFENYTWSFSLSEAVFPTLAVISAGTVSVTALTPTIVQGNAAGWTGAEVGMWIKIGTDISYYRILASNAGLQQLTIETNYAAPPVTASSYYIFQKTYSLAANCRRIEDMTEWFRLSEKSLQSFNRLDPQRNFTDTDPLYYCYTGLDSNGSRQIELWPIPVSVRVIRYPYTLLATPLAETGFPMLPGHLVLSGTLADAFPMAIAKESAKPKPNIAAINALEKSGGYWANRFKLEFEEAKIQDSVVNGAIRAWNMPGGGDGALYGDDYYPSHDPE